MLPQELKAQVLSLPPDDRLMLIAVIVESLKNKTITQSDRSAAIQQMRGLLKTDQPAPSDEEVDAMLEERRVEKYLQGTSKNTNLIKMPKRFHRSIQL